MHSKVEIDAERAMGGLSAQERRVIDAFTASEKPLVTIADLLEVLSVPRNTANQIMARLQHKGWLVRMKRGHYRLVPLGSSTAVPAVEDAWALAMELFAPCYISGWSAAEHWDLTEQIFNSIAVITTRPQRHAMQNITGVIFHIRKLRREKIFGTTRIWSGSRKIEVADPHRLIIDILDDPSFGGGGRHTIDVVRAYWKSKHADPARLFDYARRYNRGSVFKRLGFTAENSAVADTNWLDACREKISAGISKLDTGGPAKGHIVSRWNLLINIPMDET
jgi:predicted transcriptional regulator of viral defense system